MFAYKSGEQYQLVEGYPKTLQEELGMEGPLDATFVCGDYSILHVIKGRPTASNTHAEILIYLLKYFVIHFVKVYMALASMS